MDKQHKAFSVWHPIPELVSEPAPTRIDSGDLRELIGQRAERAYLEYRSENND